MNFDNLHQILRSLYEQMMPLCGDMAGVAKGIAGLGALFYVAYRVWQSLARAEPIDVFPMLRPFAIGLCIMFFPTVVLGTINSIMSPVVQGTAKMLEAETLDMNRYREQKDKLEYEAMMRNPETAYLVSNEEFDKQLEELGWSPGDMVTMAGMYIERGMYNMKKGIRDFFREILELMFQAAALVIDTIRTFFLVVLAILGPIAFAIYIHQYTMNGDTRCQLHIQPADNLCHEIGCGFFCYKNRHIVLSSHIQHIFIRFRHRRKDHTGNLFGYKILKTAFSLFRIQVHQISILYITDNLYTFRGKMFKISCQLKGRSVNIRKSDAYMLHVHFRRKILQVHFLNQFGQFYSLHISLSFFKTL